MATGSGSLRDRIAIRRQENTKNPETGGLVRGWQDLATLWAEVKSINSREAIIGNVLQGVSTFQIMIRYREDIRESDQVLWKGRELNIHAAEDRFGTRKWLTIIASTAAPQGA